MPKRTLQAWISALLHHHQQLESLIEAFTVQLEMDVPDTMRLQRKLRKLSIGIKTHIDTERHIHSQYRTISGNYFEQQAEELEAGYKKISKLLTEVEEEIVKRRYNNDERLQPLASNALIKQYLKQIHQQILFENKVYRQIESASP